MTQTAQVAGHRTLSSSADPERPLPAYGGLIALFCGACAMFAAFIQRSGRQVPERIHPGDLALVAVATHKAARLLAKDRVTGVLRAPFTEYEGSSGPAEVDERPRGHGLRRAVGELVVCPYCIGMWLAAGATAGLIMAPRFTRWAASALTALTAADFLQIAYKKADDNL